MTDILAVDDNPHILMSVEGYLTARGHKISTAESAVDAVVRIRGGDIPEVLLTDIVMPGKMDGIGLAQFVRDNYPEVKILLMTGWSYDNEHGFPVLEKPFAMSSLGQWITDNG